MKTTIPVHLPLRAGDSGRFLGIYNDQGRRVGHCFKDQRFTGELWRVKTAPNGARFRNETAGITYQFDHFQWRAVNVDDPNGCRYCDVSRRVGDYRDGKRDHCQLYSSEPGIGYHGWTEPSDEQRLRRMKWRRMLAPKRTMRGRLPS